MARHDSDAAESARRGREDVPPSEPDVPPSETAAGAHVAGETGAGRHATSRVETGTEPPTTALDAPGHTRETTDRDVEPGLEPEATGRDGDAVVADRRTEASEIRVHREPKTSAAAAFALVFGLSALLSGLSLLLAPVAVVLGLVAVLVGVAGRRMSVRPGVTGRSLATAGLVTGLLGLLLGVAVLAGAALFLNNPQRLDQLQRRIDQLQARLPGASAPASVPTR